VESSADHAKAWEHRAKIAAAKKLMGLFIVPSTFLHFEFFSRSRSIAQLR